MNQNQEYQIPKFWYKMWKFLPQVKLNLLLWMLDEKNETELQSFFSSHTNE